MIWTSLDIPERKLQKPAARPRTTIAMRSKTRSMKMVPKVLLSCHPGIDAQQVAAVDIAHLGRHDAVDQPADEHHLGRVLDLERVPGAPDEDRPALAPDGEADVVDAHGRQQPPWVGVQDEHGSWSRWKPGSAAASSSSTSSGTTMETIARGSRSRFESGHGALLDVLVDARVVVLLGGRDLLAGDAPTGRDAPSAGTWRRASTSLHRFRGGLGGGCLGRPAGAARAGPPAGWGPSRQHRGARGSGHTGHDTAIAADAL